MTSRSDYPKVLVVSPTYKGKDYIFKENFEAIKRLTYPNFDYVYIDNTSDLSYYLKLRRRGAKVVHVPRGANSRQALCNAQNKARELCLEGGFDYLMFVESDIIPHPDSIQILMQHHVPVCGATYFIGHEVKVPCIFFKTFKPEHNSMGTRLISLQEVPSFLNTGLRKIHGMGLGCTLIRRDIVKDYVYWYDERFDNKHSDVYFYMELDNNHVGVYVDTNLIVEHVPSDWKSVADK